MANPGKHEEKRILLPPGVYEKVTRDKESNENQQLKSDKSIDDLQKAKDKILQLRRLAEVNEENATLLSETRKQQSIINKLRSDVKQMKMDYEAEIEKLDVEVSQYRPVIRQLKKELKDKQKKYDSEIDKMSEMLKKKTDNAKELKSQLHKAREQIKADRNGFEDVISQHAAQKFQDLKCLQESLKSCEAKYLRDVHELTEVIKEKENIANILQNKLDGKEIEINKLKEESELKEKDFYNNINQYKHEIELNQETFETTSQQLQFALQEAIKSHERAVDDFKEKINQKNQQFEEEQNTVAQLRAYIGDNLPNIQVERLGNENQELKDKIGTLMKENGNRNSTLQFMKIRLESLNEILTLQEQEMMKFPGENGATNLLTKWRHKVFALLVQSKSQEIMKDEARTETMHKISTLQEESERLKHDIEMLSHTLADRHAELQIQINTTNSLKEELLEKEAIEQKLSRTLNMYKEAVATLYASASNMDPVTKELYSRMNDSFARIASLSQRVSFATGRVQFLQGLFVHRKAKWKNEMEMVLKGNEKENEAQAFASGEVCSGSKEELFKEIQRLTQERDMLAAQVLKDTELLQCRVENIKGEYDHILQESASKTQQLELDLKDEKERSGALYRKLQDLESDLQESCETIENLKSDTAKLSYDAEKKLEASLAAQHAEFTEEIANLEKQLNGVRNEHTKTVVALRQAEHQVSREREKAQEQLTLQQRELNMKVEDIQKKNRNLEKERNMLMATVRQEGLEITRLQPHQMSTTDDSDIDHDGKENSHNTLQIAKRTRVKKTETLPLGKLQPEGVENPQDRFQSQPEEEQCMVSALKDLKFLSEALLSMKDDGAEGV